tara:strand:+ start:446 stop:2383 length:1938 start_codon:yes stop_codon:yes gene_type:complete
MAQPNTIEIKFKSTGDVQLINAIKGLDKATKSLVSSQGSLHTTTSGISSSQKKLSKRTVLGVRNVRNMGTQTGKASVAFSVLRSKMLLASFAISLVGATIGKLIKAYAKQEKVEKKLAQALKSTGHSAGLSHKQLLLMASGLQAVTTHGDEAIIEAQALMLTFTNINKEVFPQTLESILNVSDAMGQDLKQSTIQIGKALNDPIQGMSALRRIGIQLSDTQKTQVKDFMAINDVASAQKIIIKELDTQFGGMARATRLTLAGSLTALANSWGDAMEKMGESLAPFIKTLSDSLESITSIMQSEGERQLAFLTKIGASEDTIRLSRIRLLKEEAQVRLNAIPGLDINLSKTKKLTSVYLHNEQQLSHLLDKLNDKKEALAKNSRALLIATKDSKGFNEQLALGNSTTGEAIRKSGNYGHVIAETKIKQMGANRAIAMSVVEGQQDVKTTQARVDAQIAFNLALSDYMRALDLMPPMISTTTSAIEAQIKIADIAKVAMSAFSDALVPNANIGDAFRKFIIGYLSLIQGVIIASGQMSGALSMAWVPGLGVGASIAALAALEVAKAGVQNVKFAEHGFDGFVNEPTLFMTGEGNKREHVSITPLESPNLSGGGGGGVTVNIMGGIVQEDYVRNELIPALNRSGVRVA